MKHSPEWAKRIDEAQTIKTATLKGVTFHRVRYGLDYPDGHDNCRDCGVEHGQLHVPTCCVERCPRCGAQAISCLCLEDA